MYQTQSVAFSREDMMDAKANDIALNILGNVIRTLGPIWDRRLSGDERELIRSCCLDAARLGLRALAIPRNREMQIELLRERALIQARLDASLVPGAAEQLAEAFWEGFRSTVNGAVLVAFAAV